MAFPRKRICLHCRTYFRTDPRNARKQKYCSRPECRKASKAASQKRWLNKPENIAAKHQVKGLQIIQHLLPDRPGQSAAH